MSNPFKAIGKVFKKVVKVVKKVALPALAIGAVVLTGGAALGVLPSIGALGTKIGLSAGLSGILSTAGQSALIGGGLSLVTGGNPIKGMTRGFIAGGLLGATGLMSDPLGLEKMAQAGGGALNQLPAAGDLSAKAMADGAMTAAGGAAPAASTGLGLESLSSAAATSGAAPASLGLESLTSTAASSALPGSTTAGLSGVAPLAKSTGALVSTQPAGGGGFLGLGNMHPLVQAQLIQGLGGGLSAAADAKDRRREIERREENYSDTSGLFQGDWGVPMPERRNYRWAMDKITGRPFKEYFE